MLPQVNIGLVGFGSIARTHLSALAALPATCALDFKPVVVAIATHRVAEVGREAEALGIGRVVPSVQELLEDPTIEVVDVTSRNLRHREEALAVLSAGKNLYVEKPIGRTAAEAADVVAAAGAASPLAQPGLVFRYDPAFLLARALVAGGAIGAIRAGRVVNLHGSYLDPARPISWRLSAAEAGGGSMLDLGVHAVDAIRLLLGEPSLRAARAATVVKERPVPGGGSTGVDVDDWAWAELDVADAIVTLETSRVFLGHEDFRLEMYGTEGSLSLTFGEPGVTLRRFDGAQGPYRSAAAADPWVKAAAVLRPAARLTLGAFVDVHAAGLHHFLRRVRGADPAPGLAPALSDALAAERLAHEIVLVGLRDRTT